MTMRQYAHGFDVFISYADADRAWAIGWLLPQLEAAGLRVCVDERDFALGAPGITNIEQAIQQSRYTLLVLTPNWLADKWSAFVGLVATSRDPAGQQRRILPLLLKQSVLPPHLAILTFADFTDPTGHPQQIERIIAAIHESSRPELQPAHRSDVIAMLAQRLRQEKGAYGVSGWSEYTAFDYIGFRETKLSIELVAFVRADRLDDRALFARCDTFFRISQSLPHQYRLRPGMRNPNGLLGFVFEEHSPDPPKVALLSKQSRISHASTTGAVVVPWVIDVPARRIFTHKNPVSFVPPVILFADLVYPGLRYLRALLMEWQTDAQHSPSA